MYVSFDRVAHWGTHEEGGQCITPPIGCPNARTYQTQSQPPPPPLSAFLWCAFLAPLWDADVDANHYSAGFKAETCSVTLPRASPAMTEERLCLTVCGGSFPGFNLKPTYALSDTFIKTLVPILLYTRSTVDPQSTELRPQSYVPTPQHPPIPRAYIPSH